MLPTNYSMLSSPSATSDLVSVYLCVFPTNFGLHHLLTYISSSHTFVITLLHLCHFYHTFL